MNNPRVHLSRHSYGPRAVLDHVIRPHHNTSRIIVCKGFARGVIYRAIQPLTYTHTNCEKIVSFTRVITDGNTCDLYYGIFHLQLLNIVELSMRTKRTRRKEKRGALSATSRFKISNCKYSLRYYDCFIFF